MSGILARSTCAEIPARWPDRLTVSGCDRLAVRLAAEGVQTPGQRERVADAAAAQWLGDLPLLGGLQRFEDEARSSLNVLLHTFAHALIREFALECGYSASGIAVAWARVLRSVPSGRAADRCVAGCRPAVSGAAVAARQADCRRRARRADRQCQPHRQGTRGQPRTRRHHPRPRHRRPHSPALSCPHATERAEVRCRDAGPSPYPRAQWRLGRPGAPRPLPGGRPGRAGPQGGSPRPDPTELPGGAGP